MAYENVLQKMRDYVRSRNFVMTLHAEEEMDEDQLSVYDIESCILTGRIVERQKDAHTSEWKYVIKGEALSGDRVVVVGKLSKTGKLVLITTYRE